MTLDRRGSRDRRQRFSLAAEIDLAEAEGVVGVLGRNGKDILDRLQDGAGNERRAIGSLFNAPAEEIVEGLGVQALLAKFFFDEFGSDHSRHLSKPGVVH